MRKFWNAVGNFLFQPVVTVREEKNMITTTANIVQLTNGRFALVSSLGIENTYGRRRDAVRGAKRLGLIV